MDASTIVVTSGKGGVGKTTVTANLGVAMALLGYRTLLMDLDIGLRNLDLVMGLEARIAGDLIGVLQGSSTLEQAIIEDRRILNLSLLPASQEATKDDLDVGAFDRLVRFLMSPLQASKLPYDLRFSRVLIDCPAGIESGFKAAVAPADGALVVVNPEASSLRDADRIITMLDASGIRHIQVVINRTRADMIRLGAMISVDQMVAILGVPVAGIIPDDDAVIGSSNVGVPVVMRAGVKFGMHGQNLVSPSAQAFMDMARRLSGEDIPLQSVAAGGRWTSLLRRLSGNGPLAHTGRS